MKSSQSNFNLRSPGSYLARSYLIATVKRVICLSQLELHHVIHESTANNWYRCRAPLQRMCSYHFTVSVCIDRVFLLYTDGVYIAAFALNCPYSLLLLGLCILEMFSDTRTIFWSSLTSWIQSKAAIKLSDISRLLFFCKR